MHDPIFHTSMIREDIDLEAKKATGRDGKGTLPQDLWETYSAFANTSGGIILLGIAEKSGVFKIVGIKEPDRILNELWNLLNNPQKVSHNLLSQKSIHQYPTERSRWIIEISVPRANRKNRPVYINGNPLTGTFKRNFTGDYRCSDEEVRRMLAEQIEDIRDNRILKQYGLSDIDQDTLKAYRQRFQVMHPDHPFNNADDLEFLRQCGGWRRNREAGNEGLTLAGLLMFGKQLSIEEALPYYALDYRELPQNGTRNVWIDRFTLDGTWSGNIFDFYRQSILRLFRGLKVPFKLQMDQREDDTPVHKALREALVNTLVHADYTVPMSILILKGSDFFEFRNPGSMRISIEDAFAGGHSDCRNRNLQKMFALVGLGERAGSGIPRVVENWKTQHYRLPELHETHHPEATHLRLRTVSLLPEETIASLKKQFGTRFTKLNETERLILATAHIENFVTNTRIQQICREHPRDITALLRHLVENEFLKTDGRGRATTYHLPGFEGKKNILRTMPSLVDKEPSLVDKEPSLVDKEPSLVDKEPSLVDKEPSLVDKEPGYQDNSADKRLLIISEPIRSKKRINPDIMRETIQILCSKRYLSAQEIACYLNRNARDIQKRFIKPMLDAQILERRYPSQPNHENQAYRTKSSASKDQPLSK